MISLVELEACLFLCLTNKIFEGLGCDSILGKLFFG